MVRSVDRWCARPPIVGEYERPLSLTTTTSRRSWLSAMLLSASQAMPPVSAPSPMTATTCRSVRPRTTFAFAMPSPHDSAVDACEFSTTSCSDSARDGYPDSPPCLRSAEKSWRPVRSLCT
ncbi:Uncharacterised protein [Mycobacteroides abscessus]|nr:Uncharacterised protein [Mycobacteroides abscessus]